MRGERGEGAFRKERAREREGERESTERKLGNCFNLVPEKKTQKYIHKKKSQVEVLVEIAATRAETSGKISSRYTPLAWLEGVKAAARLLLLLRRGGGRILLDGGASLPLFGGGGNSGDPPSSSTSLSASSRRAARTAAVFAAFSEFREKRGLPPVPQYQRAAAALKGGSAASAAAHAASAAAAAAVVPPASSSASTSSSSSKIRLWWDSPLPLLFRSPLPSPRRSEIEPADEEEQGEEERGEAEERRRRNANDFGLEPGNENTAMSLLHSADAAADAAAWRGAHAMALGEILFVARPLTYVLALRRSSSRSSLNSSSSSKWTPWLISSSSSKWTPWLISLSVDALSAYLLRRGASRCRVAAGEASRRLAAAGAPAAARAAAASAEALDWSRDEAAELARRRALLALYLLRKPAFDAGVGPVLDGGERVLSRVPLLGLLVSRGADIVRGVTGYYTYTSGS